MWVNQFLTKHNINNCNELDRFAQYMKE